MVVKANVEAGPRGEEGKLLGRQADNGDQPLLGKQDVKQKRTATDSSSYELEALLLTMEIPHRMPCCRQLIIPPIFCPTKI